MSEEQNQNSPNPVSGSDEAPKQRILIGSQKDPAAYRGRPQNWAPTTPSAAEAAPPASSSSASPAPPVEPPVPAPALPPSPPPVVEPPAPVAVAAPAAVSPEPNADEGRGEPGRGRGPRDRGGRGRRDDRRKTEEKPRLVDMTPRPKTDLPRASDVDEELEAVMSGMALDTLLGGNEKLSKDTGLEIDSRHMGRVVAVRRDDVFIELGSREQGVAPVSQFAEPPAPGTLVEVVVKKLNPEEGLYELSVPSATSVVGDWSDITEGITVEATVTGHNTGGLEVEVNRLRGFIPYSQIALFRVDSLAEFVGQKMVCVIVEADPDRRKLVLSRRAVLEREKEEAREKMFSGLAVGQTCEGIVRKIMDFGAFVDLGGVDGLVHVSQLGWQRVNHPSEVVQEGQAVRVKIVKIDPVSRKLGLSIRDVLDSPWLGVDKKYPINSVARGKVSKLMEFGAFVQLEPGVEGLVHISELSPKRIRRPGEVVSEGQEVDVQILSVDVEAQRISLSMKALAAVPEDALAPPAEEKLPEAAPPPAAARKPSGPLKGGVGRQTGGDRFGLKW